AGEEGDPGKWLMRVSDKPLPDGMQLVQKPIDCRGFESTSVIKDALTEQFVGFDGQRERVIGALKRADIAELQRAWALEQGEILRIVFDGQEGMEERDGRRYIAPCLNRCERDVFELM